MTTQQRACEAAEDAKRAGRHVSPGTLAACRGETGPRRTPGVAVPPEVVAARQSACDACAENVCGVCQALKALKGSTCAGKVATGVKRAEAHCPLDPPKWGIYTPATTPAP